MLLRLLREPYGGGVRRAFELAEYFWDRGECFSDPSFVQPGDLVFYRPGKKSIEMYRSFGVFECISHIGIVAEDTSQVYDSHGHLDKFYFLPRGSDEKKRSPGDTLRYTEDALLGSKIEDGVGKRPLAGKRVPAFFARPHHKVPCEL